MGSPGFDDDANGQREAASPGANHAAVLPGQVRGHCRPVPPVRRGERLPHRGRAERGELGLGHGVGHDEVTGPNRAARQGRSVANRIGDSLAYRSHILASASLAAPSRERPVATARRRSPRGHGGKKLAVVLPPAPPATAPSRAKEPASSPAATQTKEPAPSPAIAKTKEPASSSVAAKTNPKGEFQPLFNGRDLTGWVTHPGQPGRWHVRARHPHRIRHELERPLDRAQRLSGFPSASRGTDQREW